MSFYPWGAFKRSVPIIFYRTSSAENTYTPIHYLSLSSPYHVFCVSKSDCHFNAFLFSHLLHLFQFFPIFSSSSCSSLLFVCWGRSPKTKQKAQIVHVVVDVSVVVVVAVVVDFGMVRCMPMLSSYIYRHLPLPVFSNPKPPPLRR